MKISQQLLFSLLFLSIILTSISGIIILGHNKREDAKPKLTLSQYRDLANKYPNIK